MKPELTSKVIFVCPAFCEESGKEGYRTKEEIEKNEMMAPYIEARNKKDVEFIRGAYASFYDSLSKEVEKEVLDDVFNQRNFVEVMVMIAAYDTMNFDNFKANALLIYGADDEIIPN